MKTTLMSLCLILLAEWAQAINGLEQVIVEKYYVSNAADAAGSMGTLPVGSVTYRIYADMLPGYKLQAVYGVPGHELRFGTTTTFFNNEDRGAITPTYTKPQAADNTVMLDSWFSVGGACSGNFGVLKSEDNGIATVVNNDGILQNADPSAGIPLTVQDGLIAGTPEAVTQVGFTNELDIFDATSSIGSLFTTTNGSIASLNGSTGPTASNRVLIAQLTTDGILSFELNIQIGVPGGGVQQYVARDAVGTEIVIPSLTYNRPVALNLKTFIQGFYTGAGAMNASVDPGTYPLLCDSLDIELHDASGPHNLVHSKKSTIDINGSGEFVFSPEANGGEYYLVIKHRNSIETWSNSPVTMTVKTDYDFSDAQNKAFGNNLIQTFDNIGWAIYSGDINHDGAIDGSDFLELDPSIQNGDGGYAVGDINGDGAVDGSDFLTLDPNIQNGVGAAIP